MLSVELMAKLVSRLIVDGCSDRSDIHGHETEASRPRGVAVIHDLAHFYFVGRVLRFEVPVWKSKFYGAFVLNRRVDLLDKFIGVRHL